ncbi:hypothetical protein EJB05_11906, partial [Eragrostis curvula]
MGKEKWPEPRVLQGSHRCFTTRLHSSVCIRVRVHVHERAQRLSSYRDVVGLGAAQVLGKEGSAATAGEEGRGTASVIVQAEGRIEMGGDRGMLLRTNLSSTERATETSKQTGPGCPRSSCELQPFLTGDAEMPCKMPRCSCLVSYETNNIELDLLEEVEIKGYGHADYKLEFARILCGCNVTFRNKVVVTISEARHREYVGQKINSICPPSNKVEISIKP